LFFAGYCGAAFPPAMLEIGEEGEVT
jgi:hypothetical protein